MFERTDPVIRAIRAPFEEISATLGAKIDEAAAEFDRKVAEHERHAAEVAEREARLRDQRTPGPAPKRRVRRPEPDDPSETGFYSATWMTNK